MLPDYHIHTFLSDGNDDHESYINKAIEKGIKEIGFSDHIVEVDVDWRMQPEDIPLMIEIISIKKKLYKGTLDIKFGAEVDFIPGKEKQIKAICKNIPFDYIIGAIHFIDDWSYDTDPSKYEKMDIYELYKLYFKTLQASAASGMFDIIGHADFIKKFGHYPNQNINHLYSETAKIFKESDIVVELNTNGLNKPCKEFFPSPKFLQICFDNKIPVCLGSDAHKAENLAQYYNDAQKLLKTIGYKEVAVFSSRERSFIAL
ncbi:MAG: histidinol-phosphatase HisJ family protein [Bacteroidia bacterium]|nr:histidinol-phosphatase HisJ family protein [Bacteroidia bacterium]